jgi:hypothetical protein
MYYHQAMRVPDKEKFKESNKKECEDHFRESNYKLMDMKDVPKYPPLLSSVWQMKRRRKPSTGEISKYKARMNVVNHYILYVISHVEWLVHQTTRFLVGLHPDRHRKGSVHEDTSRLCSIRESLDRGRKKEVCTETRKEPVWTKTSKESVVFAPKEELGKVRIQGKKI